MTTDTRHWARGMGWHCPTCGTELHSVEMLGIHMDHHSRDDRESAEWLAFVEKKEVARTIERR